MGGLVDVGVVVADLLVADALIVFRLEMLTLGVKALNLAFKPSRNSNRGLYPSQAL